MKKGFRIVIFSLLFLGGVGMITWYLIMRRQVPQHAQCIPKNAIAVLTLNLRELALDRATGGHLFPELADKPSKELERFTKAIEKNDGAGLAETADVLGFMYLEGESAFFGVSASLNDSAKFGKLLREQLNKEFSLQHISSNGASMLRFDTSSAIIGWNKDIVLFLYPVSNEGADKTAEHCAKLLKQTKEASVLTDENFCTHELASFDAGLWVQPQQLMAFTGGGSLFRVVFNNMKYLSLAIDFQDGEVIIRNLITEEKISTGVLHNAPVLLTCEPKQVIGFYRSALDLQNDSLVEELSPLVSLDSGKALPPVKHSLLEDYAANPPLNMLPLDDEQIMQLAKSLDGNFTVLVHDTFSYDMDFITYDYDADFNRIPKQVTKRENEHGLTASFGLKDQATAKKLLTAWMEADSIPFSGNTWMVKSSGASARYMMIADNVLSVSNWKQTDGKPRPIPESWMHLDMFLPVGKVVIPELMGWVNYFYPQINDNKNLLSQNMENILVSEPLIVGNTRSSQIRLTMRNRKVNALVQLEELFLKIKNVQIKNSGRTNCSVAIHRDYYARWIIVKDMPTTIFNLHIFNF
jgi:hypothetical protein